MEEPEEGFAVLRYGDSIVPLSAVSATSISGGDLVHTLVPHRESEALELPSSKGFLQLLGSSRSPSLLVWCEGKLQDELYNSELSCVSSALPQCLLLVLGGDGTA